jgi:predicted secreted protein
METKERKIETKTGETFQINFWEDRTLGYAWYPTYDSAAFDLIEDDYQRTIRTHTADSGKRLFRFLARRPGNYEIRFEKKTGWKFTVADRIIYQVQVKE